MSQYKIKEYDRRQYADLLEAMGRISPRFNNLPGKSIVLGLDFNQASNTFYVTIGKLVVAQTPRHATDDELFHGLVLALMDELYKQYCELEKLMRPGLTQQALLIDT